MVARNAFAELAQEHTNHHGDAHLVSGNKIKWRREFNDILTTHWDKYENGIVFPEPSNGTLVVPMGTTISAESWIVSKEIFTFPLRASVGIQISQKISYNEIYFELVGCDATGELDETRVAAFRIAGSDSSTTTVARTEVRNGGAARTQSGNVSVVSMTTGGILEITAESDEVWFSSKPFNSSSGRTAGGVQNAVCPDPSGLYKIRIRFRNSTVAPASSTNVTLSFALGLDYTEQQVEITGGNGSQTAAQSVPVSVMNSGGVTNPILAASASTTGVNAAKVLSAASTNATLIKASAGRVYGYKFANHTSAWKYVRFYNLTVAPVVGTSTPVHVVAIPPNSSISDQFPVPVSHATGISYAITGAVADLDSTAVAANDVQGTIYWI